MKVLFVSHAGFPDFQHDVVFHGGRTLLGDDFVDVRKVWHQYKDDKEKYWNEEIPWWNQKLPKGVERMMSLYGLFDTDNIDRTDIETKIRTKYFDYIILGSVHRVLQRDCGNLYQELIFNHYPANKLIFIDGEDSPDHFIHQLVGKGFYFKRELIWDKPGVFPITFGIPREKLVTEFPQKTRELAHIIPGDFSTYIYNTEEEYYNGYKEAYFGMTTKKGGWDCMRHYEILANRCIPYFPDLPECPHQTLYNFPKDVILESNKVVQSGMFDESWYMDIENKLHEHTKKYLTTDKVVEHMFNQIKSN
jgi:hypothetical protein